MMRHSLTAMALSAALVAFLVFAGMLQNVFAPIPLIEQLQGYLDPETKLYVGMGEIVNYSADSYPMGNVKLDLEFQGDNGRVHYSEPTVTNLLPVKGGFSIPPGMALPFVIVLNDTSLSSKVKSIEDVASQTGSGTWKPADLVVTPGQIHSISESEFDGVKYKTWAIEGTILNNYTQPTTHVYVVAGIHEGYRLVGVAGYSQKDKQPLTLGGMEKKNFTLYATMPANVNPDRVNFLAESDDSSMMRDNYLPILSKYSVNGVPVGSVDNVIIDNKTVTFTAELSNFARKDVDFDVVFQVLKVPFSGQYGNTINDDLLLQQSTTADLQVLHSSINALGTATVDYSWTADSGGYYAYAIYVVNDLDSPKMLSKPFMYKVSGYPPRFLASDMLHVK
ncbi:hypothetical protein [Candidatus Nitrososphaera evergladensis]|nr:hypothetical protein [Candidatus Nitrososphaera evergladensis]